MEARGRKAGLGQNQGRDRGASVWATLEPLQGTQMSRSEEKAQWNQAAPILGESQAETEFSFS